MAENIALFWDTIMDAAWIVETLLSVTAWVILCWKKENWKILIPAALGLFAVQTVGGSLLFAVLGMSGIYPLCYKLLKGATFFLFLYVFSAFQWKTKLLIHFALFNIIQTVTSLSGQCSILIGAALFPGAPEAIVRCAIQAVIPLIAVYLRKHDFDNYPIVPISCIWLEIVLCVGILVVNVVETFLITDNTAVVISFMASYFSLALTSLMMIHAVHTMCAEQKDIIDLQAEKQRFQTEREMRHLAQNTLDDLRSIRHDLKNQYSYMEILLAEKRYDELNAYFHKLQENMPEQLNLIDCGNHTVNIVLNMEFAKLRSDRISVEHQLVVPPVLPFPDREMCSILANLLDNAGDECRRLLKNGWTNAKLRIEIYPHQSYLYIRCMNSTDREALERSGTGLLTTKHDKQLHGYGTKIIAKLAEKYNGCAQYHLENNMFVAQVMMDMTWEGENV